MNQTTVVDRIEKDTRERKRRLEKYAKQEIKRIQGTVAIPVKNDALEQGNMSMYIPWGNAFLLANPNRAHKNEAGSVNLER